MGLAILHCRAQIGVDAPPVTIEVLLSSGLPTFNIVGLAETAVRESKDRVRGAILSSNFDFPQERITVNLGPADMKKPAAALTCLLVSEFWPHRGKFRMSPCMAMSSTESLGWMGIFARFLVYYLPQSKLQVLDDPSSCLKTTAPKPRSPVDRCWLLKVCSM